MDGIIGGGQVRESTHGGDLASSWEMQMCPENNGGARDVGTLGETTALHVPNHEEASMVSRFWRSANNNRVQMWGIAPDLTRRVL